MTVLTISREFGSKGDEIARLFVQRTGYQLIDKAVIEDVYLQFGFTDFQDMYDRNDVWTHFDTHHQEMVHLLQRIFRSFANRDNILLLGRGGFSCLQQNPNILHVLVKASVESRIKYIQKVKKINEIDDAEKLVFSEDKKRADFINSFHDGNWESGNCFDILINTDKIPVEMAVEWLEQACSWIHSNATGAKRSDRVDRNDPVMDSAIEEVLASHLKIK